MAGFNNNPGSGAPDNAADFRADMSLLNAEDGTPQPEGEESETPEGEEPEGEEPEGEEPEGEEEEPEGEEEESEEEEEPEAEPEATPIRHSRPTVREITAKYPDFFKQFPDMRHMLFREGEYAKVFPTVEDARSAADGAEQFSHFSDLLASGKVEDFEQFLGGIKEAGSLTTMAAHFLPALYKADQNMYFQLTTPIAEGLVRNAFKAAAQAGNDNLKNAALHIAQWAFGDVAFATGEKRSEGVKVDEPKGDAKFEQEKTEFYKQKYTDAQGFVQGNARTRLVNEINKGLDPNNVFTPTVKNLLIKEILSEIGSALEADDQHMKTMNSMWKNANKAGFAGDWKDRLLTAYLSRARALVPATRQRIRTEAMKTEQRKATSTLRRGERSADRRDIQGSPHSGSRPNGNGRPPAAQEINWSKTSDLDFLNDKISLKKA